MIPISDFRKLLSMELEIIKEQTKGLTQADTLTQPQSGGNCMNWVLGHLLENQVLVLEILGGNCPIEKSSLSRYTRESEPITSQSEGILELETLLNWHEQVHAALKSRLGQMTDTDFDQEIMLWDKKATLGWRVFFLHFHYTYHIGQLEFLRNLAGHTEKVI
jgi:hypothetical protein